MPKIKKENKKKKSKKQEQNDTINLDNEIVIGLKIKEDLPVEKPKEKKVEKTKSKRKQQKGKDMYLLKNIKNSKNKPKKRE